MIPRDIELPEFYLKIMVRTIREGSRRAPMARTPIGVLIVWPMLALENTKFVMDGTYFNQHFVSLRPYLTKLVEIFPNVYEAKLVGTIFGESGDSHPSFDGGRALDTIRRSSIARQ